MNSEQALAIKGKIEHPEKWATIPQMAKMPKYNKSFTQSSLRYLIFNSENRRTKLGTEVKGNGLKESGAILKVGRKVLIDLEKFDAWVGSHAY